MPKVSSLAAGDSLVELTDRFQRVVRIGHQNDNSHNLTGWTR